nr:hypothetical protein CFP56_16776 [Quercus suber]
MSRMWYEDRFDPVNHYRVIPSLLMTCRTIYEEVIVSVYSSGSFYMFYQKHGTLDRLRRLSPSAVRALSELTICLASTSCSSGNQCVSTDRYPPEDQEIMSKMDHGSALGTADPEIFDEWHSTWQSYLRPHILPSRLYLSFICDVSDETTGKAAVLPFLDQTQPQPLLAGCSVRLGRRRNPELETLAQRTVLGMTAALRSTPTVQATQRGFRFTDLPRELRLHILGFTDLITPNNEVEWNPQYKLNLRHAISEPETWRTVFDDPIVPCWRSSQPRGCFCRAYHAAYSTIYHCECWAPPTSFFLISRQVRQDALAVFYSQNKFVVTPDYVTWESFDDAALMTASAFLTDVLPRDSLKLIRRLEFVFAPKDEMQRFCGNEDLCRWTATLCELEPYFDLPRMTLEVSFAQRPEHWDDHFYNRRGQDLGKARQDMATQAYIEVLSSFKSLHGLGRFFVYIMDRFRTSKHDSDEDKVEQCKTMTMLEQETERMVMGAAYDAHAVGKGLEPSSKWLPHHNDYIFYQLHY